jgi:hypothetical protein
LNELAARCGTKPMLFIDPEENFANYVGATLVKPISRLPLASGVDIVDGLARALRADAARALALRAVLMSRGEEHDAVPPGRAMYISRRRHARCST